MARWTRGEAVVERLLAAGDLQAVRGAQADGQPWLVKADRTVTTSATLVDSDPASAVTLAYDAARFAAAGVLAHQGLRSTTRGGHLAIDEVVRAQFGDAFRPYRGLRIRRNEIEYPAYADEVIDRAEAAQAVADATEIIAAAAKLLPHLGLF